MIEYKKRIWVEINLDAIKANLDEIKKLCGDSEIIAVIKADGYGHGAVEVGLFLQSIGVGFFAVSSLREAVELRRGGIRGKILVLGYTAPDEAQTLADEKISQAVFSSEYAEKLSKSLDRDSKIDIHIKLNTGMNRIGFNCCGDLPIADIENALSLENLRFEGLFTHFAAADRDGDPDAVFTELQYSRYISVCEKLAEHGFKPKLRHCCNSAATLLHTDKRLDAVRPGIILYGLTPDPALTLPVKLTPAMTFKAVVSMLHTVTSGDAVSYGLTYRAKGDRRLATITAGYADGFPRFLSNRGTVLINGTPCPIVGKVCMDQTVVDVTDLDGVCEGDEVVLFGKQKNAQITAEEIARLGGTINYEIVCGISRRVPRYYLKSGKQVTVHDYLIED